MNLLGKKVNRFSDYVIIFLLSLIPLIFLFYSSSYLHTQEGAVHITNLSSFYQALRDGQFPVRWIGDYNFGFGSPIFIFAYQLPFYFGSAFIFSGLSLMVSFKLTIALSYILSGIFMLLFARFFFEDRRRSLLVTILYQFAPFRFSELFVRGGYGEVFIYAVFPLVLYTIFRFIKKRNYLNFVLLSVSSALFVLTNTSLIFPYLAVIVLFAMIFSRSRSNIAYSLLGVGTGILLASYFWIPAFFEYKYIFQNINQNITQNLTPLLNIFIPNLLNSPILHTNGMPIYIGIFQTLTVVILIGRVLFYRFQKIIDKRIYLFSSIVLFFSVFFMTPVSRVFWDMNIFGYSKHVQYPWEFMSLVVLATSTMGISLFAVKQFREKYAFMGLIFFIFVSSLAFWIPKNETVNFGKADYLISSLLMAKNNRVTTVWSEISSSRLGKHPIEILDGNGAISNYQGNSFLHTYTVSLNEEAQIVDHTYYFPGWKVYVDGMESKIEFKDTIYSGQILYWMKPGDHVVRTQFEDSRTRYIADSLSLTTAIALIFVSVFLKIKMRFK